jgi:hypothetical protein
MSTLTEKLVCVKFCFKLGKTFTETFGMLPKVFVDEYESYEDLRVVQKIQGRRNFDWRGSTLGAAFNLNWWRFHSGISSCHSFKLTVNSAGGGRWLWNISGFMSYHFSGKVRHASRHSRICSVAAGRRAGFSHKNGDYSHSTATLVAGSSACRLFTVLQSEIHLESTKIWHHRRDKRKFTEGPEGNTKTNIPGLLQMVEGTLGAVY